MASGHACRRTTARPTEPRRRAEFTPPDRHGTVRNESIAGMVSVPRLPPPCPASSITTSLLPGQARCCRPAVSSGLDTSYLSWISTAGMPASRAIAPEARTFPINRIPTPAASHRKLRITAAVAASTRATAASAASTARSSHSGAPATGVEHLRRLVHIHRIAPQLPAHCHRLPQHHPHRRTLRPAQKVVPSKRAACVATEGDNTGVHQLRETTGSIPHVTAEDASRSRLASLADATVDQIQDLIRYQLDQILKMPGVTHESLAHDIGYTTGSQLSRIWNSRADLPVEKARALDELASARQVCSHPFADLVAALRSKKASKRGSRAAAPGRYDLFLAMPMASTEDEEQYAETRRTARELVAALENHCAFSVYCAALQLSREMISTLPASLLPRTFQRWPRPADSSSVSTRF